MPDSYKELIKSNPDETEIRSFLVDGDQVSVTLRIPDTLRDAAKEEAALRGMSFSAFVRTCMIEELAKKGHRGVKSLSNVGAERLGDASANPSTTARSCR